MIGVTHRERQLLDYIIEYMDRCNGIGPSYDEMSRALGIASRSGIHRLVCSLQGKGLINRLPFRNRAIEVTPLGSAPASYLAKIPTDALVGELRRRGHNSEAR